MTFRLTLGASLLLCMYHVQAQIANLGPTSIVEGDIYALVIGISTYQDSLIKSLDFAHRDAELFASYLQSESGGSVPRENIKLLTNEQATIANIYNGKQWLEEQVQKDDLVFFYFSGHGDVESSLYKLGFLLAHDTPHKNYLNNAVRIEDFNIMANTLSVTKEAQVILITDACHSGKLAGSDNRGTQLVGEQLQNAIKREVRMASCEPDQLAQEGEDWGGGRGAFSYHLINGLMGLADTEGNDDGIVTKMELESYVGQKVMMDVMEFKGEEQTPVVQGKPFTKLALVVDAARQEVQESLAAGGGRSGIMNSKSVTVTKSSADLYFERLAREVSEEDIDMDQWQDYAAGDIVAAVVARYSFDGEGIEGSTAYLQSARTDKQVARDFERRIAALFHDEVQQAINAYLVGNKEELERRQYYNSSPEDFLVLAEMLDLGSGLVDTGNYLYHIMTAKALYFRGISTRLHYATVANPDSVLLLAMAYQQQALDIDDRASYVHNERGIIHRVLGGIHPESDHFVQAEAAFKKAIELTPRWALPKSNLANLYERTGRYQQGVDLARQAIQAQPDYYLAHVMLARNASNLADYLTAEEHLLESIKLNNDHYYPFENLGVLYTSLTDYGLSDYYFMESERRKAGFSMFTGSPLLDLPDFDADGVIDMQDQELDSVACKINPKKIHDEDANAAFVYGLRKYRDKNFDEAKKYMLRTISLLSDHPLAYYYLGQMSYLDQNWIQGHMYMELSDRYYMSQDQLAYYWLEHPVFSRVEDCDWQELFMSGHYPPKSAAYLLAHYSMRLGRYTQAERIYLDLIKGGIDGIHPYHHLWALYEARDQYEETEATMWLAAKIDAKQSRNERLAFYRRMISANVAADHYRYKAGMLCFAEVDKSSYDDNKVIRSDDGIFVDVVDFPVVIDLLTSEKEELYRSAIGGDGQYLTYAQEEEDFAGSARDLLEPIADRGNLVQRGEVLYKLADLYRYIYHDYDKCKEYYERAVAIIPSNASIRGPLISRYITEDRFTAAYVHLRELYDRQQITYDQNRILAKYAIHSGDYALGDAAMDLSRKTNLLPDLDMQRLDILRHLFASKFDEVIKLCDERIDAGIDRGDTYYTMARVYALQDRSRKAVKALNKAADNGFDYSWVVDYDPIMELLIDRRDFAKFRDRLPRPIIDSHFD